MYSAFFVAWCQLTYNKVKLAVAAAGVVVAVMLMLVQLLVVHHGDLIRCLRSKPIIKNIQIGVMLRHKTVHYFVHGFQLIMMPL